MILSRAKSVLQVEARAIAQLAENLGPDFEKAVEMIAAASGRVILTGMGKSGIICRKIAATFASTGTPAFYLHPAEAIHGDLGMIVAGDIVIAISNSGETEELLRLLTFIKRQGAILLSITGNAASNLARHADHKLVFSIDEEGCPLGLAPMASTTTTLALGDALAAAIMDFKGFTEQDFARYHPGGKLGSKLLQVSEVMHKDDARPLVDAATRLSDALMEMSEKRLGMTAVALPDGEIGVISDGDVRRLLQTHGRRALELRAGEVCSRNPKRIAPGCLAVEALRFMEQYKITALLVLDEGGVYCGVIHLHDLWRTQML